MLGIGLIPAIILTMKLFERLQQPGSRSQLAVAASLLLLLPLLAWLQYHWLGQLSAKEQEHMQTALRAAATRFSQDFNREITRVYGAFLTIPNRESDEKLAALAESYDRWRETAAYPKLVKSIFVVTSDGEEQLSLTRLDFESKQFSAVAWPEELIALRDQIQQSLAAMRQMPAAPPSPDVIVRRPAVSSLNGEIPALVFPLIESPKPGGNGKFTFLVRLSQFVVVALDPRCLQQNVLPPLIQRHFVEDGQLSYELTIVNRHTPPQIVYQSGSSTLSASSVDNGWDYKKADTSISLFSLDREEINVLWRGRMQYFTFPTTTFLGVRKMTGPPKAGEKPPPAFPSPQMFTMSSDPSPGGQPGVWQMHIRHRAGSLEAAVGIARRRNLLISFSILVLLAASVSLLLISSQRARRLAQQQMDFVAGISHELHTPIAVIDSAGYNLAKGVMKSPEQIKKYGLLIRKETGQLKEIVEQILEFAGMQSHRQRYDLLPTSINRLIEDVLASSQPLLDEGGFQVETSLPSDPPTVMADALALSRAVQNLLNNAMKYSGENRWIGLRAETVNEGQEPSVQLTVSDHGLGIPAEELAHIFQPFYRGNEARAAQIRGNGLGLSLVKNIIEAHGGSVSVRSRQGAGSSFTLSLPATATSHQPSAVREQLQAETMSLNVGH